MLQLLLSGQIAVFLIALFAIIFSLTLHEFGHAAATTLLGDDTATHRGRLTLNPFAHIDPVGLLMVVLIGFGYAKPMPINTRVIHQNWARALVAAAGPLMNLLLAVVAINFLVWATQSHAVSLNDAALVALTIIAKINLLLMLFNLIPLGSLDGHYILQWFLPSHLSARYSEFNSQYGDKLFLVLIALSFVGVPIFNFLMSISATLVPYIIFIR